MLPFIFPLSEIFWKLSSGVVKLDQVILLMGLNRDVISHNVEHPTGLKDKESDSDIFNCHFGQIK